MYKSKEELGVQKLNSATRLIQKRQGGSPMQTMYYIGLDCSQEDDQLLREGSAEARFTAGWGILLRLPLDPLPH
jgi:hypothetical protein